MNSDNLLCKPSLFLNVLRLDFMAQYLIYPDECPCNESIVCNCWLSRSVNINEVKVVDNVIQSPVYLLIFLSNFINC